jgi:hypothetical protein
MNRILVCLAISLCSIPSFAQYEVNLASAESRVSGTCLPTAPFAPVCDERAEGFRIAVARHFASWRGFDFSNEIAYKDYGHWTRAANMFGGLSTERRSAYALELGIKATYPFASKLEAYASVGYSVARMSVENTHTAVGDLPTQRRTKASPYGSIGLGFIVVNNVSLFIERRTDSLEFDKRTPKNVTGTLAGISYRF